MKVSELIKKLQEFDGELEVGLQDDCDYDTYCHIDLVEKTYDSLDVVYLRTTIDDEE